jgi:hypothetical protein
MTEVTTINKNPLLGHYNKMTKYGVHVKEKDYQLFINSIDSITIAQQCEKDRGKALKDTIVLICLTFLNIQISNQNNMIVNEICKLIRDEYGNRMSIEQIMHAFEFAVIGKIPEVDLSSWYGQINISCFFDVINGYLPICAKARKAAKEVEREQKYLETVIPKQDGLRIVFDGWVKDLQETGVNEDIIMYYANSTDYGKHFIVSNWIDFEPDYKKEIYNAIRKDRIRFKVKRYQKTTSEYDEFGNRKKNHVYVDEPVSFKEHPIFYAWTYDKIYIYTLLHLYALKVLNLKPDYYEPQQETETEPETAD